MTPTLPQIAAAVERVYSVTLAQLRRLEKTENVSEARQVAMFLARERTTETWEAIGTFFERDRTTVHHAHRAIFERKVEDRKLRQTIEALALALDGLRHLSPPVALGDA